MTTETIESPAEDLAEISAGKVLVQYNRTEAALVELKARHAGAKFDLTTTAGDKAARAARLELVTLRTGLEKKRKELKGPALEFGKKIDAEAARLTAEIEALERPIDAQIRADEQRRADEKAERDRIEAARKATHECGIAIIRGYVAQAAGKTSAQIAAGISAVEALKFGPEWEEYEAEANGARTDTLEALRALHRITKDREDAAAAAEAQRVEQARIAAEQAAEAQRLKEAAYKLAADQAELARQMAELKAAQLAAQPPAPVEPKVDTTNTPEQDSQHVLKAEAETPDATARDVPAISSPSVGSMGAGQPADAGPAGGIVHGGQPFPFETFGLAAAPQQDNYLLSSGHPNTLLLSDCLAFVRHAEAAFAGTKFPTQPKPGVEWWATLKGGCDVLARRLVEAGAQP